MKRLTETAVATTLAILFTATSARGAAVDLLQRYPTTLTSADTAPERARPWQFGEADVFRLSSFKFAVGTDLQLDLGASDLGVGHCSDGAVWAVVMPREGGKLTSQAGTGEEVAHVWLRFHPKEIGRFFPARTVSTGSAADLLGQMRAIANSKFRSSYHAGPNAMIPDPKDLIVDVDTQNGVRRFLMVDIKAQTVKYAGGFEKQPVRLAPVKGAKASVKTMSPSVVKTVPQSGDTAVDPSLNEIRAIFSKDMTDRNWSVCQISDETYPEGPATSITLETSARALCPSNCSQAKPTLSGLIAASSPTSAIRKIMPLFRTCSSLRPKSERSNLQR
jgi:hypothetical protein